MDPETFEAEHDEALMRAADETEVHDDVEDDVDVDAETVVLSEDEDTDPMLDTDTEEEDPEEDPEDDSTAEEDELLSEVDSYLGDPVDDAVSRRSPLPMLELLPLHQYP